MKSGENPQFIAVQIFFVNLGEMPSVFSNHSMVTIGTQWLNPDIA